MSRVVSTGFASRHDATDTVGPRSTLKAGQLYLYWFDLGGQSAQDAIEAPPRRNVQQEPALAGTPLTVALFAFPGELEISPEADIGEFLITADGSVQVTRQPLREPLELPDRARLLFPVRTPEHPGWYRLRCNLYCRQTLLQSRLVEVQVTSSPHHGTRQARRSTVDYAVSTTLDPRLLTAIQPLRLSVFLDDNDDGTRGFRFFGEDDLKGDAVIDGQALQDLIGRARVAYRRSAWDRDDEWNPQWKPDRYIYRNSPGWERLGEDLMRMARAGSQLWSRLAVPLSAGVHNQLPPGRSPQRSLRQIMRRPGVVEVACRFSTRMVLPASILYDYPLDTNRELRVCPDALDAIASKADLAKHQCFTGSCAHYDDDTVVCPGGFWGYRHSIGLPQSRAEQADGDSGAHTVDSWLEIRCTEKPEFVIGVADDFNGDHVRRVRALGSARSRITDGRDALLAELRAADFGAHIVYLFCHGALVNGIPALQVGPRDSEGITHDNIEDGSMYWEGTHPLVVLNCCSTAAVEPQYALTLVDAFVRGAFAAGVIGSEITVFESLATRFAEEFFARFLRDHEPVGEAVRRARLQVLAVGNPLGLVYVVYAAPGLRFSTRPGTRVVA